MFVTPYNNMERVLRPQPRSEPRTFYNRIVRIFIEILSMFSYKEN